MDNIKNDSYYLNRIIVIQVSDNSRKLGDKYKVKHADILDLLYFLKKREVHI